MREDLTIGIDVIDSEGRILAHVYGSVTDCMPEVEVTFLRAPLEVIEQNYDRIYSTKAYVQKLIGEWLEQFTSCGASSTIS